MKITKENNFTTVTLNSRLELFYLLKNAQFVGYGKTSFCVRISNGLLLKIYRNTKYREDLFNRFDMKEHILELSTLKNDSYVTPNGMLKMKEEVLGYFTEYKHAYTIEKIKLKTTLEFLLANLEKLIEDTYKISEKHFLLGDVHNRNILFNGYYYVIDLDFGFFEDPNKNLVQWNITTLIKTILETIFKVQDNQLIIIDNPKLFNLYNDTIYRNYKKIYEFFEVYKENLNAKQLTIRKLRRSYTYHKEYNSYYRYD